MACACEKARKSKCAWCKDAVQMGYDRIDLVVSFIMKSGLEQLRSRLEQAIGRGAQIRVLTTDYLAVTDADAWPRG